MPNELLFHFADRNNAKLALDTLQELGYTSELSRDSRFVRIHLESDDLTSALEISQSSGGTLVEEPAGSQHAAFQQAYPVRDGYEEGLAARDDTEETLRLPAHMVTEDFPEFYMHPESDT